MTALRPAVAACALVASLCLTTRAEQPGSGADAAAVIVETHSDRSKRMTVPVTIEGQGRSGSS